MNVRPEARKHNYALQIENILRNTFECGQGGFMGLARADYVENNLQAAIIAAISYRCGQSDEYLKMGEEFLKEFEYYIKLGFDELLKYNSETRSFMDGLYSLEEKYSDVDDLLEKLIDSFERVIK